MPTKLIIDNRTKLSDEQALLRVVQVVKHHPRRVIFMDGFIVRAMANKNSVRFTITKQ